MELGAALHTGFSLSVLLRVRHKLKRNVLRESEKKLLKSKRTHAVWRGSARSYSRNRFDEY